MKYKYVILLCGLINTIAMGQSEIHDKLKSVTWQEGVVLNSFIDSLFQKENFIKEELLDNKINDINDRYELIGPTKNYFFTSISYKTGRSIIRSISNMNNKIEYWNYFYNNGNLKRTGYTIGSVLSIGTWENYSETGQKLESLNYEEKRFGFNAIYDILKNLKVVNNDLDFYYMEEDLIWRIEDWTEKIKYFINENGEVNKEKFD